MKTRTGRHFLGAALLFAMITVHEAGHYAACRMTGVGVEEFSVGIGPTLYGKRAGTTDFTLRLLPIAGFNQPNQQDLQAATFAAKALVSVSGTLLNVLCAFLILLVAGRRIGVITAPPGSVRTLFAAVRESFGSWLYSVVELVRLIAKNDFSMLAGPLGIIRMVSRVPSTLHNVLRHVFALNMGLAVFNLLPLQPLDGGKLVSLVVKGLAGPRVFFGLMFDLVTMVLSLFILMKILKGDFTAQSPAPQPRPKKPYRPRPVTRRRPRRHRRK